jgi:hypothetical protein
MSLSHLGKNCGWADANRLAIAKTRCRSGPLDATAGGAKGAAGTAGGAGGAIGAAGKAPKDHVPANPCGGGGKGASDGGGWQGNDFVHVAVPAMDVPVENLNCASLRCPLRGTQPGVAQRPLRI